MQMGNAMVSLRRLSQYLVMEERNDTVESLDRVGLDIQGGNFYWCEPPATKKLDGVKGAPGQGKKRSLLSIFGGLRLRKGPAIGTGPAKGSGMHYVCLVVTSTLHFVRHCALMGFLLCCPCQLSADRATRRLHCVSPAVRFRRLTRSCLSIASQWQYAHGSRTIPAAALCAEKEKTDKVESDDVSISMEDTQDASKLGRQVAPGESSSSSSSSSSDGQAEHLYSGTCAYAYQ